MKQFFFGLLSFIVFSANSQMASRILTSQGTPDQNGPAMNIVYVDTTAAGLNRFYIARLGSITMPQTVIFGLPDSLRSKALAATTFTINGVTYDLATSRSWTVGDVQSSATYSNPSWITSLAWAKITGAPTVYNFTGTTAQYTRGDGTYATFPTDLSSFANGPGYLTTVSSGQVTGALGYTPVPNTRTLTINGTALDLSANRSWSVGDLLSSGSYANPTWLTSLAWSKITGAPSFLTANQTITLSGDVSGSGATSITTTLANSGVSAGTYNGPYTVDAKGRLTVASNESINPTPNRSLSTTGSDNTFTISATRPARVRYTVNFAFALTLTTSNGVVSLDYSTNGGSTWISCGSVSNSYTLAVTLSGNTDAQLTGDIPAGALVRIYRSANTNVTVTLPTNKQQEVTD